MIPSGRILRSCIVVYLLNQNSNLVNFEIVTDPRSQNKLFSNNASRTIFSGMSIMANESYSGPAWATGLTGTLLSEYWAPQRGGMLIIHQRQPSLEIIPAADYSDDLMKRAKLYQDLKSGEIQFFTLGQLFLYAGKNQVSKASSGTDLSRNILVTNAQTGAVGYFKFYDISAYEAVEVIRTFGMTEAFNFDAFSGNYEYHVSSDGVQFGIPGINTNAYSKFNVNLNSTVQFPALRESRICTADADTCSLKDYMSKYPQGR